MSTNSDRSRAALLRDAALDRVRRTRRWVVAGTALLTAGIAALVSSVAPGRTLSSKSSSGPATTTASSASGASASRASAAIPSMPRPANAGALGLQAPNEAPSPAQPQQSQPQQQQQQSQPQQSQPQPQESQPQQSTPSPPVVSGGS